MKTQSQPEKPSRNYRWFLFRQKMVKFLFFAFFVFLALAGLSYLNAELRLADVFIKTARIIFTLIVVAILSQSFSIHEKLIDNNLDDEL
ncbi:MAG: hypothetical protein WCR72_12150 [Bacteroidota bacterium]